MGPPASSYPSSIVSFESREPGSGRNYEADHLRMLLSASQENLAFQQRLYDEDTDRLRRRHEERQKQMRDQHAAEKALYQERIAELERNNRGEGGSGSRRG
jgi:hypothetical protein